MILKWKLVVRVGFFTLASLIIPAFAQDNHLVGDHFSGDMLDSVIVFPVTGLQTPFNVDLLALGQELVADLGQATPGDNVKPLGLGAPLAI